MMSVWFFFFNSYVILARLNLFFFLLALTCYLNITQQPCILICSSLRLSGAHKCTALL